MSVKTIENSGTTTGNLKIPSQKALIGQRLEKKTPMFGFYPCQSQVTSLANTPPRSRPLLHTTVVYSVPIKRLVVSSSTILSMLVCGTAFRCYPPSGGVTKGQSKRTIIIRIILLSIETSTSIIITVIINQRKIVFLSHLKL